MKRLLFLSICMLVVFSLLGQGLSIAGAEDDEPVLSLSKEKKSLKPGKTASVLVEASNPWNDAMNLTLEINSTKIDWVSLETYGENKDQILLINDTAAKLSVPAKGKLTVNMKVLVPLSQEKESFDFQATLRSTQNDTQYDKSNFSLQVEDPKSSPLLFVLALAPLLVVFVGIIHFKQPGMRMALVGWLVAVTVAVIFFKTSLEAALWASVEGIIKSFGITIAVMFTMFMIFIMKETGALKTVADAAQNVVKTKEEQAIFLGIGFGSFLTCLGVVTPALFPPLLVAMGFTPFAAVAIAVLGYNATTSFALLSIPITLPADTFGINDGWGAYELAFKISIFLPIISIALSYAILWVVGGKESMKKGSKVAFLAGAILGITTLFFAWLSFEVYTEGIPIKVMGVFSSLVTMAAIYLYSNWADILAKMKDKTREKKNFNQLIEENRKLLYAISPWIILVILVSIISIGTIEGILQDDILGSSEEIDIKGKVADLNVLTQVYTWILISTLLSFYFLKPTKEQLDTALTTWKKRVIPPAVSYSVYFCIAMIMARSCMEIVDGKYAATEDFASFNMNNALGVFLADTFGGSFILFGVLLGVFGAIAGGSETGSNILFYGVQKRAAAGIDLSQSEFMTLYAGHAVAGGVASAVTPAKITNAVSTIGEGKELEAAIMQKHLLLVMLLTVVVGLMTAVFILVGL